MCWLNKIWFCNAFRNIQALAAPMWDKNVEPRWGWPYDFWLKFCKDIKINSTLSGSLTLSNILIGFIFIFRASQCQYIISASIHISINSKWPGDWCVIYSHIGTLNVDNLCNLDGWLEENNYRWHTNYLVGQHLVTISCSICSVW